MRHRVFYDTLVRTVGPTDVARRTVLFGKTNIGLMAYTNLTWNVGSILSGKEQRIMAVEALALFSNEELTKAFWRAAYLSLELHEHPAWGPLLATPGDMRILEPIQLKPQQELAVLIDFYACGTEDFVELLNADRGSKVIQVRLHCLEPE